MDQTLPPLISIQGTKTALMTMRENKQGMVELLLE
jgi:hypothetical protein